MIVPYRRCRVLCRNYVAVLIDHTMLHVPDICHDMVPTIIFFDNWIVIVFVPHDHKMDHVVGVKCIGIINECFDSAYTMIFDIHGLPQYTYMELNRVVCEYLHDNLLDFRPSKLIQSASNRRKHDIRTVDWI